MKNFTKQNFKTNPLWIRLLIMAFMLLGVLVPQSAMAVGHTQNLNIGYNDGSDHWTRTIANNGTIALGELESAPKLIGINAYTTKYNGGNICSGSVSVENATYDATSINWKYNNSDNDQEFWFSINRTLSSTVGDHSVTVTVTIKGGATSSSCSNSYQRTFKITYTIKETEKEYSLGGYLNGGDKAYNDAFKLTKQNDGTYKGTFNNFTTGTHYFQVFDDLGTKWGVNSYTTLEVGNSTTLNKTNNNEKVGIPLTKDTPYVFTFNPSNGSFSVELSCTAPKSVSITDAPSTKPCPGDKITLGSTVTDGTGDITYAWTVSGTGWSIENNASSNESCTFVVGTGEGTINLSATQCSTEKTANTTISVKSKLAKSNYTLQASADWTGIAITPTIAPGTNIPAPTTVKYGTSAANATTTAPTAVGEYKVFITTVATDNYCAVTDLEIGTFEIVCPTVTAPTITATSNVIKCGDDVTTPGSFKFTKVSGLTYTCNGGTVGDGTVTGINAAGTYTFTATNGCDNTASTTVTISETQNQPTISAIEGDQYLCAKSGAHTYSIKEIDGATYLWSISGDGLALGDKNATSTTVTPGALTTRVDGTLTVKATDNASGCLATQYKSISLIPLPTLTSISPTGGDVCSGATIADLENSLTIVKSEGTTTEWYKNTVVQPSNTVLEKATYAVRVRSDEGCLSDNVKEYTVTNIITIPTIKYIGIDKGSICEGEKATITAKADGATSYTLYKGTTNNPTPVETKEGGSEGVTFTVTEAGTYKFKATNSCGTVVNFSDAVQLTVLSTPAAPSFTTNGEITCAGVTVNPTLSTPLAQNTYLVWYDAATGGNKIGTDGKTLISGADETENTYYAAVSNGSCESATRTAYTVTVESSAISDLTLTLTDDKGNVIANPENKVYCQGENVHFKLTYNGGMYWGEPEWNSTVTQTGNLMGDLRYDPANNKGEGTYTIPNVQGSGTIAVALTMCGDTKATSNALTINVAPVPSIKISASTTAAKCYQNVTLTATTENTIEGSLVIWYKGGIEVGRGDSYTFTSEAAITVDDITASVQNTQYCAAVTETAPSITFTAENCSAPALKQGGIAYMAHDGSFHENNCWYAAYFFNASNSKWVTMLDEDGDGTYACEIPTDKKYTNVIFCCMTGDGYDWNNKKYQTGDLSIQSTAKKYYITNKGDGTWQDLQSGVTFRTVELNAGENWHDLTTGVKFEVHAWEGNNSGTWYRMVDADGDRIYHVDIPSNCDQLLFARLSYNATDHEYNTIWNQTENLYATGGTRYVITQKYDVNRTSTGYWSWPGKSSSYTLGVNTLSAEQDGENYAINCSAQMYLTNCAPGIWYGFQYKLGNGSYQNVKVGEGYLKAGDTYETKLTNLEAGTYTVRARVQYANNSAVYGQEFVVIIGDKCTEGYEFTLANTATEIIACGGSKELPAMDIVGDKNNDGQSFTYLWTNEDGTAATNLSANNVATPVFTGKASQNYKVTASKVVNQEVKCVKKATYQVNYTDNSPKATIVAPTEAEMNEAVTLQGTISNSEGFTWTVTENSIDVTTKMLSDVTILNPEFNTTEAGTYTITLEADATEFCEASSTSTTITVDPIVEVCGGTDIEIGYDFSVQKPNWVNTSDFYYTYKLNGGSCVITTTSDNNKLYNSKPTFTLSASELKDTDFPITLYFVAQSEWDGGVAYAEVQITADDKGKKVLFSIPSDAKYTSTSTICLGNNTTHKANKVNRTESANTTISAPTVTNPSAQLGDLGQMWAVLSAYFGGTGCANISSYGFEYIQSESEPTSWTNPSRVEVGTSTPTLGKSFSAELTGLEEGTYWFRAYATNSKTTGYSASASFLIITNGAYPQLNCNEGAVKIVNNKVQVTVNNIGNEELLKGSYQLLISNQAVPMPFTPSPVPAIAVGGSQVFTTTIDVMDPNNLNTVVKLTYQGRSQQCSITRCEPKVGGGDTIFYTIDAAAITDKCMLVFPTIYDAVNHLKASTGNDGFVTKVGDGYILRQPVVMQVAYSSNRYVGNVRIGTVGGMTDGRKDPLVLNITNINNDGNSASKGYDGKGNYYPLIIRAANPNAIPSVQHIALRKSRQVTLQNLNLVSSDTDIDNAIDIDNNNNSWTENAIGAFRANIRITNCNIKSKGFTCIHVSAVEDVFFQNNEINADLTNNDINDNNTRIWGASAKFIRSTRILFLANNFTGSHATSVWLQGCETVLFMNNVFWNNNLISTGYPAMIRLIQQTGPEEPKNSGFYYNTMYLAESNSPAKNFDFLALNTQEDNGNINHNGSFQTSSIEFMYNNCYSYSATTAGKSSKPLKDNSAWEGICSNNFWSVYDMNTKNNTSKFEINGCKVDVPFINVQNNVCTTTTSDPNSLVISGTGLNIGIQPESDLAESLGANLITSDRTREGVRPTTPTIIDPDDVPSGVVDSDGFAPAIALVVSDNDGEGTMTHAIDVAAFTGTVAYNEYSATLAEGSNFTITKDAGVVTIGFSKDDKTKNVTYNDQVIIARNDAAAGKLIIPITGKYVSSYTGGWTLGAYQQTESIATDSIIWQGGTSSDWDNRNNWIDAKTKNTLTCVNTLAKDLKVIIPAPESQSYPTPEGGITTYPELPESFGNRDTKTYGAEIVNAGQGLGGTVKQFADHIILEYGASLRGVEALVDNEGSRYNEATTHLEVERSTWILVGNMLKPFTNINKTETRLLKSGDYYFARQEPNVYMHQVLIENNTPTWQKTFADLEVTVLPQEAFAIQIPDQYGKWKLSAEMYYSYVSPNVAKIRDAEEPKSYTFNGRFINEAEPLTFTGLNGNYIMANNTYPCNLNANAIETAGYSVQLYNYVNRSWGSPDPEGSTIKPQHGFAIKQTTGGTSLKITRNMLAGGDTRYNRSATVMPYNVIKLLNANSTDGYASEIQVWYDVNKGAAALDVRDTEKLWSNDNNVPDLYILAYDKNLQRMYVESDSKVIPLGVQLYKDMDVTFALHKTKGFAQAILQDRETGKEYDLLNGKAATITGLEVGKTGVIEGRFFLNLVAETDDFNTETAIDNIVSIEPSIGIYTDGGNTIRVLANNAELQTIYVSDMSGRTSQYNVSGSYANITLPVNKGIYLVQVIGDNVTRTEKVVIK